MQSQLSQRAFGEAMQCKTFTPPAGVMFDWSAAVSSRQLITKTIQANIFVFCFLPSVQRAVKDFSARFFFLCSFKDN